MHLGEAVRESCYGKNVHVGAMNHRTYRIHRNGGKPGNDFQLGISSSEHHWGSDSKNGILAEGTTCDQSVMAG